MMMVALGRGRLYCFLKLILEVFAGLLGFHLPNCLLSTLIAFMQRFIMPREISYYEDV